MGGRSSGASTPSSISSDKGHSILDPLSTALEGSDPLSALLSEATDPLSQMAAQMSLADTVSHNQQLVQSVFINTPFILIFLMMHM